MNYKCDTYKRLGDYIQEVDVRNSAMEVNLSQGICNMKYFQDPRQVSSTPHLDKIVRKGQFAYNRATTRNGNKISIAYREGPDCTVSSAYCVFQIIDEEKLNPYYLWLWFKRPNFDRYAIFKSHGSAHEFFEFETLCNTYIPIPPIDEQLKLVNNYLIIQKRIENNKRLINKLEETALAIYRKMFVNDINPEDLPKGWELKSVNELSKSIRGVTYSSDDLLLDSKDIANNGVLVIRGNNIENSHFVEDDNVAYIPQSMVSEEKYVRQGEIVMTMSSGSPAHIGKCFLAGRDLGCVYGAFLNKFVPNKDCKYLLYLHFVSDIFKIQVKKNANGCGIDNLNLGHFDDIYIPFNTEQLNRLNSSVAPLFEHIANLERENIANTRLLSLINY